MFQELEMLNGNCSTRAIFDVKQKTTGPSDSGYLVLQILCKKYVTSEKVGY